MALAFPASASAWSSNPATRTHQFDAAATAYQAQVFLHYPAPHRTPACYADGCRWHHATQAAQRWRKWQQIRAYYAHPSIPDCWAMLGRAFGGTAYAGVAHNIVDRESHCYWAAKNPTSTATGVFQFLDHWGPSSSRYDAAWSIARARRAMLGGGISAWSPVPW